MNNERRRVLDLLAGGKITTEEADQLLGAMGAAIATRPEGPVSSAPQNVHVNAANKPRPKYLRIQVEDHNNRVNIRVPLSLLRAGMRLASLIPAQALTKAQEAMNQKGITIDLSNIKPAMLEELIDQLADFAINVDGESRVQIFCE
jgi:hypothetical protein